MGNYILPGHKVLGASEITANLYCNCVHLYWKVAWFAVNIAVIYETLLYIAECPRSLVHFYTSPHLVLLRFRRCCFRSGLSLFKYFAQLCAYFRLAQYVTRKHIKILIKVLNVQEPLAAHFSKKEKDWSYGKSEIILM